MLRLGGLWFEQTTRNTCTAETLEARMGEVHKLSGMEVGERIEVNCVAWEGGFPHWL